jgi:hypothetical protein
MDHGWLDTSRSLAAAIAGTPEQHAASAALWRLTPEQRVAAMWRGELSLTQLAEWSRRAPREVPHINSEFAWIVISTADWIEASDQPKCEGTGEGIRECRCGAHPSRIEIARAEATGGAGA